MENIGDQIKRLRTTRKMTQLDLAKRLNITKSAVSAYENGSRMPSYDVLIKISQIFHVSVDNLLGCSSSYTIDVTGLTDQQRNTVLSIILTYKSYNLLKNRHPESDALLSKITDLEIDQS